jgi:glycosyltransferase involved in cell wall biosynthesis
MSRIALCCPIDRHSAIARASLDLAATLALNHTVVVFGEPSEAPLHCPVALRPLAAARPEAFDEFDRVITVLGDSGFHRYALRLAIRRPTIVILHDVLLAHLVVSVLSAAETVDELHRWYGADAASSAGATMATSRPFWDSPHAMRYPLFEVATANASGVVVHSQWAASHVRRKVISPVRVLPLAYRPADLLVPHSGAGVESGLLVTIGNANSNKRHELVIEALALLGDPRVRYAIGGSITPERRSTLTQFAESAGVLSQVDILGPLTDENLADLISRATVCMNLRDPAMEGGSASLIEQMLAGKPVVVFDHGCYADAPDGTVVKLAPGSPAAAVARAIRELLTDERRRTALGAAAHRFAIEQHAFGKYAAGLVDFFDEVDAATPTVRLVQAVRSAVSRWGGVPAGSLLGERWATLMVEMLEGATSDGTPGDY